MSHDGRLEKVPDDTDRDGAGRPYPDGEDEEGDREPDEDEDWDTGIPYWPFNVNTSGGPRP